MRLLTDNYSGLFGIVTEDQRPTINFYAMGFVQQDQSLMGQVYPLVLSKPTPLHTAAEDKFRDQKYLVRPVADEQHLEQITSHANQLKFDIYQAPVNGLIDDQLLDGVRTYKKHLLHHSAPSLETMTARWQELQEVPYEAPGRYDELECINKIRYAYTMFSSAVIGHQDFVRELSELYMHPDYDRKQFVRVLGEALRVDTQDIHGPLEDAAEDLAYERWDAFSQSSAALVSQLEDELNT